MFPRIALTMFCMLFLLANGRGQDAQSVQQKRIIELKNELPAISMKIDVLDYRGVSPAYMLTTLPMMANSPWFDFQGHLDEANAAFAERLYGFVALMPRVVEDHHKFQIASGMSDAQITADDKQFNDIMLAIHPDLVLTVDNYKGYQPHLQFRALLAYLRNMQNQL